MWIQPMYFPYEKIFYTMVNWVPTNRVTWEYGLLRLACPYLQKGACTKMTPQDQQQARGLGVGRASGTTAPDQPNTHIDQ